MRSIPSSALARVLHKNFADQGIVATCDPHHQTPPTYSYRNNTMTIGLRFKSTAATPFVRPGTNCWLQEIGEGSRARQLKVIGRGRSGSMVSGWVDLATVPDFYIGHFFFFDHGRKSYRSAADVKRAMSRLNALPRSRGSLPATSVWQTLAAG
jgi:hypothetical protein